MKYIVTWVVANFHLTQMQIVSGQTRRTQLFARSAAAVFSSDSNGAGASVSHKRALLANVTVRCVGFWVSDREVVHVYEATQGSAFLLHSCARASHTHTRYLVDVHR